MSHHDALSHMTPLTRASARIGVNIGNMRYYASCVMVGDEKASPTGTPGVAFFSPACQRSEWLSSNEVVRPWGGPSAGPRTPTHLVGVLDPNADSARMT